MKEWNRRYVIYSEVHGRAPADQMAHDEENGIGVTEYVLWNSGKILEWKATLPKDTFMLEQQPSGTKMQEKYDEWLLKEDR